MKLFSIDFLGFAASTIPTQTMLHPIIHNKTRMGKRSNTNRRLETFLLTRSAFPIEVSVSRFSLKRL
jgi:hypothetical protein